MKKNTKTKHVAITQHCFAYYRQPIFFALCGQEISKPHYRLFFGENPPSDNTETFDPFLGDLPSQSLRVRFSRLKNIWLGKGILWQSRIVRLAISKKYDTIIFEGSPNHISSWVGAVLGRITGKRILFWTQGFRRDEKGLKGVIRTIFLKRADGLLLYGRRAREICLKRGFQPEQLYLVYNSLDYRVQVSVRKTITGTARADLKKQLFQDSRNPLLLWVGRLLPTKRLEMLLEAGRQLIDRGQIVNILFVGAGPVESELKAETQRLGLEDHVRFYGACFSEEQLGLLISAADLCVAPGIIGLSCIHSLVYGTPVITQSDSDYQGPEFEAIIPGETGAYFKRGDSGDLARAIEEWLSSGRPRDKIRTACYRSIEEFYTPDYQVSVINNAVAGIPADISSRDKFI